MRRTSRDSTVAIVTASALSALDAPAAVTLLVFRQEDRRRLAPAANHKMRRPLLLLARHIRSRTMVTDDAPLRFPLQSRVRKSGCAEMILLGITSRSYRT